MPGSSQKSGAEKTDHSNEARPEAPSSSGDQRSQTALLQIIEKILNAKQNNFREPKRVQYEIIVY